AGDPFLGGREGDAVAALAGFERERPALRHEFVQLFSPRQIGGRLPLAGAAAARAVRSNVSVASDPLALRSWPPRHSAVKSGRRPSIWSRTRPPAARRPGRPGRLLLLRTMLGLEPVGDRLVVDPALPSGIGALALLDIPGRWGRVDAFARGENRARDTAG